MSTIFQFLFHFRSNASLSLIFQLMLQTRPCIHGDGPELNLHRNVFCFVRKKYRNLHHQMQTAIPALLRLFYVVAFTNQFDIILMKQQGCNCINIINVIADYPDSCHICNLGNGLHTDIESLALQFFKEALRRFQSALHMMDRVIIISNMEFIVQDLQLCADFPNSGMIGVPKQDKVLKLLHQRFQRRRYYRFV